jgi:Zn-dependent protease
MIGVAAAGPVTNIALAVASIYLLQGLYGIHGMLPPGLADGLIAMGQVSAKINVMLAAFNLLPLPPLDGGRVLAGLAPQTLSSLLVRIEPFGFAILAGLIMTQTLRFIMKPFVYVILFLVEGLVLG